MESFKKTNSDDLSIFPQWRSFLGSSSAEETKGFLRQVVKRNGSIEKYDRSKIESAVNRAIEAVTKIPDTEKAKEWLLP